VPHSNSLLAGYDGLTHVKAASNAGAGERLLSTELLTGGHKTRHLLLGELNLATAEGREVDVGDLVLLGGLGRHDCGVLRGLFGRVIKVWREVRRRTIGGENGKVSPICIRERGAGWEFFASQARQVCRSAKSICRSGSDHLST